MQLLLSFISSLALCCQPYILEEYTRKTFLGRFLELLSVGLNGDTIVFLCVFLFIYFINRGSARVSLNSKTAKILAIGFAIFMLIGKSYSSFNSWDYIFKNKYQAAFAWLVFIGYAYFFYNILNLLFYIIDQRIIDVSSNDMMRTWSVKKRAVLCFGIIFACWLPYLVVFFPGSVPYDGYYQLNMFYGVDQLTNHHPFLSTMIIGLITAIGRQINDNMGVFIYIIIQSIFCAIVFTIICLKIYSYNIPSCIKKVPCFFFAFLPVWGSYAQTLMKDVIYYGLFSLFFLFYIELIEKKDYSKKKSVGFFLLTVLLILYRNEAVYIIIPSLIVVLFCSKTKRMVVAGALCSICVWFTVNSILLPSIGVTPGSRKEMLSVPFQQTARYTVMYEEELTEEEINVIDKVLGYNSIKNKYNPINSDPVKDTYREPNKEDFKKYINVWWEQLKKHPAVYIQATLNNSFGYFYPEYLQDSISNLQFYIKGEPLATGDLEIYYVNNAEIRNTLSSYSLLWMKLPGVSLLMYPGFYTWVIIVGTSLLLRKKMYKECVSATPLILTIGICMISPVNGYLRYMLPVMATTPLFLAFIFAKLYSKENCTEGIV